MERPPEEILEDLQKELLNIVQAAKAIPGESESSLRRKCRLGQISYVKLGRDYFLTPLEVARIKNEKED